MSDLSPIKEQRHNRFVALLQGQFGQIFTAKVLEGRPSHEQTRLLAYSALYYHPSGQHEVYFLGITPDCPDKQQMIAKVASFSLTVGEAAGQYTIVYKAPNPDLYVAAEQTVDEAALQQAQGLLGDPNLPIAAITFLEATDDNSSKIVFWYPTMSQPDRLWRQFSFALRRNR